ncbi:cupin domain-containing protein [Bacillus sp. AGMB 02131]|uniref:Cupin domain-containing protein n=1 Tax=Peribacillus faecalis TaxID=2772559 RepID=A0A927CUE7_9BACI|nr:cupin domain-containing protein [Peribacillus faecalis]MBD3107246.1 cupin domain-containing protein [Peribacillus faecalis]
MYYVPNSYSYHPHNTVPIYRQSVYSTQNYSFFQPMNRQVPVALTDYGGQPFVVNIHQATLRNDTYRTALWTGSQFQITLMSLNKGEDIGLQMFPDIDVFLHVSQGKGLVQMGKDQNHIDFVRKIDPQTAIIVPAGMWNNIVNVGDGPLKLYSIYAPPNHPIGTIYATKEQAYTADGHG